MSPKKLRQFKRGICSEMFNAITNDTLLLIIQNGHFIFKTVIRKRKEHRVSGKQLHPVGIMRWNYGRHVVLQGQLRYLRSMRTRSDHSIKRPRRNGTNFD